jgi:cell division cycle protein 37
MVDYSKWSHIEVSDDEDDTHPNIDTPSLFRWRHKARVERMEEQKKEKEKFAHETDEHKKRIERLKKLMEETESKKCWLLCSLDVCGSRYSLAI